MSLPELTNDLLPAWQVLGTRGWTGFVLPVVLPSDGQSEVVGGLNSSFAKRDQSAEAGVHHITTGIRRSSGDAPSECMSWSMVS